MRIAEFSESSNLWTQLALLGIPGSMPLSVSYKNYSTACFGNKASLVGEWVVSHFFFASHLKCVEVLVYAKRISFFSLSCRSCSWFHTKQKRRTLEMKIFNTCASSGFQVRPASAKERNRKKTKTEGVKNASRDRVAFVFASRNSSKAQISLNFSKLWPEMR